MYNYLISSSRTYFSNNGIYSAILTNTGLTINNGSTAAGSGVGLAVASGNVGIGTTTPAQKLDIASGNIRIDNTTGTTPFGIIYKGSDRFIHNFTYGLNGGGITPDGQNTFLGINAGNFSMGSTATLAYQASYNTGIGQSALNSNTTGYNNSAMGVGALRNNSSGYNNSAMGYNAGRYLDGGAANETSNNSVFLGYDTRASVAGGSNEIVIGASAIGAGSHSVTLGNTSVTKTLLQGNVGIGTTSPGYKVDVFGTASTDGVRSTAGFDIKPAIKPTFSAGNLALTQMANLFQSRSEMRSFFRMPFFSNPMIFVGFGASIAMLFMFTNLPFFHRALGMAPIERIDWIVAWCFTALVFVFEEVRKRRLAVRTETVATE